MSVLDRDGRITVWEDVLARILNCSSSQALGRSLTDALPAVAHSELPRTLIHSDVHLKNWYINADGEMGIGSGVVFDSQGPKEYAECL